MNGAATNGAAPKRTLPHIQDIVSVQVDLDLNKPLRTILETGQAAMRQAKSYVTFKRPDLALGEFIRASVVAIEVVPRHKDFLWLRDRKDLLAMYQGLIQEFKTQQDFFEAIKADIIADNERTGVQPVSSAPKSSAGPIGKSQHFRSQSESQSQTALTARDPNTVNGTVPAASPQKKKPAIQPKPTALQGHVLHKRLAENSSTKAKDDLVSRFQNLRPSAPIIQDPRIKTHPIIIPAGTPDPATSSRPKPIGPREMPSPDKENEKPSFESTDGIPSLPKMPAAIYNPARGTVSSQTSNLPSSTPRGMFSRTNSIASVSNFQLNAVSTPPATTSVRDDYFAPAHSIGTPKPKTSLPDGDTISVSELRRYMNLGAKNFQILVIDVRSRADFDEGHIMSQATICIEPLTLREDMSSDEIGERMVLGSNFEVQLFERRDKFDLVVLYDERSTEFPPSRAKGNLALRYLRDALVLFEDERPLQADPKLLEGGLDAWIDVMGPHSLQSSTSPVEAVKRPRRHSSRRPSTLVLDDYSHKVVHLPDREIRKWQDLLDEEENKPESPFTPVRTTEDFLRRFPDVSSLQQSMTSTKRPPAPADTMTLDSMFPPVPSRPAPAVPRPSYTGLADDGLDAAHQQTAVSAKMARPVPRLEPTAIPTNLQNEGSTCYADSALQLLVASTELTRYLTSGRWMDIEVTVKNQDGQTKRHPQILTRILAGLFQHLQSGAVRRGVRATILRRYLGDLVKHTDLPEFGDPSQQQDIAEYFQTLMRYLDDETNSRRTEEEAHATFRGDSNEEPPFQFAVRWFDLYFRSHNSLVDAYVTFTTTESKTCSCGHIDATTGTCLTEPAFVFNLTWPAGQHDQRFMLEDLISHAFHSDQEVLCEKCSRRKTVLKKFSSLPKYLFMTLTRYVYEDGALIKHHTQVEFPVSSSLDMTRFMWPNQNHWSPVPPQMEGPFEYELYGMALHQGSSADSGHYTAYVRKQGTDWREWWYLNDSSMNGAEDFKLKGDCSTPRQNIAEQFGRNVGDVTMLCYRRTMRNQKQKQMQQI